MEETTSPTSIDLFTFLREQLASFGIEPKSNEVPDPHIVATVTCDECGFVVTCPVSASQPTKLFLGATFGQPVFDETGTLIYHNDAHFTSVMLAEHDDDTQVIVLHWKDEGVKKAIAEKQIAAIEKSIVDAASEIERLTEEAANGDIDSIRKRDVAIAQFQEVRRVFESHCKQRRFRTLAYWRQLPARLFAFLSLRGKS